MWLVALAPIITQLAPQRYEQDASSKIVYADVREHNKNKTKQNKITKYLPKYSGHYISLCHISLS